MQIILRQLYPGKQQIVFFSLVVVYRYIIMVR